VTDQFDIFLSHAKEDKSAVRALADRLRAAGLRPWLDEEQLHAGVEPKEAILAGIAASQHVAIWVTDHWCRQKWTNWELEVFMEARSEERRVIPILLIPWNDEKFGPYLTRAIAVEPNVTDDERLWCVVCAIRGQAQGPRAEWAARGLALGGPAPTAPTSRPAAAFGPDLDLSEGLRVLNEFNRDLLLEKIIHPLLAALEYFDVREANHNGSEEDLLASRKNQFGRAERFALVIEQFESATGPIDDNALAAVLTRLHQSLNRSVLDAQTSSHRPPEAVIFVTPRELSAAAIKRLEEDGDLRGRVSVLDGRTILRLMAHHLPQALSRLGLIFAYRLRVDAILNEVQEAGVAFEVSRKLLLDDIYVEAMIGSVDRSILAFAAANLAHSPRVPIQDAERLSRFENDRRGSPCAELVRAISEGKANVESALREFQQSFADTRTAKRAPRSASSVEQAVKRHRKALLEEPQVAVPLDALYGAPQLRVRKFLQSLKEIASNEVSSETATERMRKVKDIERTVLDLGREEPLASLLRGVDSAQWSPNIPASALLKIRLPIVVVGPPGSGKTTLLRRLAQLESRQHSGVLPVFVPLFRVAAKDYESFVAECQRVTAEYVEDEQGARGIASGDVHLFLDGLDEVAESSDMTYRFAQEYVGRNPHTRLVISSRDTVERLDWDGALFVRLSPFTDNQQEEFIRKWFTAQPQAGANLGEWLSEQPNMREAAKTPLILALLCSLAEAGSTLPKTETELYRGRFDLMLGRWEKAKGLAPLPGDVRDHYDHFLAALAMHFHQAERRTGEYRTAVRIADRFRYQFAFHTGEKLVSDCIKRGLLQREPNDRISFGDHLTYQEFKAAEWLRMYNRADFVWDRLFDPWWAKALQFYAAMTKDLRSLIREAARYQLDLEAFHRIHELHEVAPLTGRTSLDLLRQERETLPRYDRGASRLHIDVLE
jgi:hypothetical protein